MDAPILFAGTPANAASSLRALVASGHRVVLVLTRPDAPTGRKRVITESPVALAAHELGLPVIKSDVVDQDVLRLMKEHGCRLGIVVAYGALLKKFAIDALDLGWYNLHYSLLPALRGAAPVQRALIQRLPITGVTLFKIDEGMDTGPIVNQARTEITPDETAARLLEHLTELGNSVLLESIPAINAQTAKLQPQTGNPSLAPKIGRNEARIDWNQSAAQIEGLVRGCNPEPGAWTTLGSEPFKIHEAVALSGAEPLEPGSVVLVGDRVLVGTGNNSLILRVVQPSSKKAMPATDWFRGLSRTVRFDS